MAPAEDVTLKPLEKLLAGRLKQGSLSASEFMALALYHPEHGYYRQETGRWGFEGADYYTALDCGPLLGETLAARFQEAWDRLGRPGIFTILEAGAGRGWLGRDILASATEPFASSLRYLHCDDHPAARIAAREALRPWLENSRARFVTEADEREPFVGAVLSNELFDALPTQPWRWDGTTWAREVLTPKGPTWEVAEAGEAGQWFESQADGGLRPGDASIWCEVLPDTIQRLCGPLRQGLFVTLDYGDTTPHLLAKGAGLRRFRSHRTDTRWWEAPGQADLTADVDFTRLEGLLETNGLGEARLCMLGQWIREHAPLLEMERGWLERSAPERVKRTENLLQLTLPTLMGDRFRVLEAWKGPAPRPSLGPN